MTSLSQTIPALPVRDAEAAVGFYRDRLGFAGTAGCRVQVQASTSCSTSCMPGTSCTPVSTGGEDETDFGTREFATLDQDGNLVTFFQWVSS